MEKKRDGLTLAKDVTWLVVGISVAVILVSGIIINGILLLMGGREYIVTVSQFRERGDMPTYYPWQRTLPAEMITPHP
jgi:hypothetical protein